MTYNYTPTIVKRVPALHCSLCNDRCYYDMDNGIAVRGQQVAYHYFLGWDPETCADFAEMSEEEVTQIVEKALSHGGLTRTDLAVRCDNFVKTPPEYPEMLNWLQHDIAKDALDTSQKIITRSTQTAREVQEKLLTVTKRLGRN